MTQDKKTCGGSQEGPKNMGESVGSNIPRPIELTEDNFWIQLSTDWSEEEVHEGTITIEKCNTVQEAQALMKYIITTLQEYPILKNSLEISQQRYSKLLNFKTISGKDQEQDMKVVRSSLRDFIELVNQWRSHYDKSPQYIARWEEAKELVEGEILEQNNKLYRLKQKIKDRIDNLYHQDDVLAHEQAEYLEELIKEDTT